MVICKYVPRIMTLTYIQIEKCKINEVCHNVNEAEKIDKLNPYMDAASEMESFMTVTNIGTKKQHKAKHTKTCHRDRIAHLTAPCPSHKNFNLNTVTFC